MNILLVTCGFPYPPVSGPQLRDFHLLQEVSAHARVSLCSLLTEPVPEDISGLSEHCASIDTYPLPVRPRVSQLSGGLRWPLASLAYYVPELASKIRERIVSDRIDIVQMEHSFLACYRDAVPPESNCRTVLSLHNIGALQYRRIASLEHGVLGRLSYGLKAVLMRGWEPAAAARFHHTITVSEEDRRYLLDAGRGAAPPLRVSVIENGVDARGRARLPEEAAANEIVFVGILGYPPNADAAVYFCRDILPLVLRGVPDAHLTVIGRRAPASVTRLDDGAHVTVAGFVDNVTACYRRAKIAIAPLRAGGGTRLKILEAMALGRAIVSTTVGCEGLAVVPGKHLLVGDTPAEFAAHVVRLLRDEALRRELAANARMLVEERYDWGILGRRLIGVYRELLGH